MRIRPAILALLLLSGCRSEPVAPPADGRPPVTAQAPQEDTEHANLLNVGWGAAVVSRTAELTLDNSAIRAIDGDLETLWATPPLDFHQTMLFSLPAPARVDKVGVRTPASPTSRTKALTIEASANGRDFVTVVAPALEQTSELQLFDAALPEARFIRVTTTDGGTRLAALQTVHIRGSWLQTPGVRPIADCWSINGFGARLSDAGGRITGTLETDDATLLDGGAEGAVYRFAWARGAAWGYALVTLTPDGQRLSGLTWHEEPAAHSFGTSWFGERRSCTSRPTSGNPVVATFLRRAGWFPLFSLQFDKTGALIEPRSRGGLAIIEWASKQAPIRIVSYEYREATADANRLQAESRLRSLREALVRRGVDLSRIEWIVAGNQVPRRPTHTEPMRLFYSAVEIQVPDTARSAF